MNVVKQPTTARTVAELASLSAERYGARPAVAMMAVMMRAMSGGSGGEQR